MSVHHAGILQAASPRDYREAVFIDKYIGCLLGGLVGDCMGAPFDSNFDDQEGDDLFENDVRKFLNRVQTNSVLPGPSAGRNHHATKGTRLNGNLFIHSHQSCSASS